MIHTNKFSLERAKNGEPFTFCGFEATFSSVSPDGKYFSIWHKSRSGKYDIAHFYTEDIPHTLSMTPKKLEVKIWRDRVTGVYDATTEDVVGHETRTADPKWELLKTKSEEI